MPHLYDSKLKKHEVPVVSLFVFKFYKTKHSYEKILPNMLIIAQIAKFFTAVVESHIVVFTIHHVTPF